MSSISLYKKSAELNSFMQIHGKTIVFSALMLSGDLKSWSQSLHKIQIEICYLPAAATAKSLQSCPTLCASVHGIFQARVLEWGAVAFSINGSQNDVDKALEKKELVLYRIVRELLFNQKDVNTHF